MIIYAFLEPLEPPLHQSCSLAHIYCSLISPLVVYKRSIHQQHHPSLPISAGHWKRTCRPHFFPERKSALYPSVFKKGHQLSPSQGEGAACRTFPPLPQGETPSLHSQDRCLTPPPHSQERSCHPQICARGCTVAPILWRCDVPFLFL